MQNAMRLLEVPQALGFSDDGEASRRSFAAMLRDAGRRRDVTAAIERQAEHFDMLGLQLGFSYEHGALIPDGSEKPPVGNAVREFVASSCPGSRLPHGWLASGNTRRSSLDLIVLDRLTLLVGPDGAEWISAARNLCPRLECVRVGTDFTVEVDRRHAA
jgi:2,4-dichlorophenol 6-monooxygenase